MPHAGHCFDCSVRSKSVPARHGTAPEKECEQQRPNVGPIHISIREDHHSVVAQACHALSLPSVDVIG